MGDAPKTLGEIQMSVAELKSRKIKTVVPQAHAKQIMAQMTYYAAAMVSARDRIEMSAPGVVTKRLSQFRQ